MLVEHVGRLAALVDNGVELLGESRHFECKLSVVLVDIKLTALRASLCRGLGLVDCDRNAVLVEHAGESAGRQDPHRRSRLEWSWGPFRIQEPIRRMAICAVRPLSDTAAASESRGEQPRSGDWPVWPYPLPP